MRNYLLGCDVLGAEKESTITVTTVPPTSLPMSAPMPSRPVVPPEGTMYGPASSSGTYYTDKNTITAVQKKLAALGYFNAIVDGRFGKDTEAAIFNYSGQHGPPDDVLLAKLGLRKDIAFLDEEVDSMIVQAKTATTPAQVQLVAAKAEKLVESASPDVKAEIASAKQTAAAARTTEQAAVAKDKLTAALAKAKGGMPAWKLALIISGSVAGVLALLGGVSLLTRPRTAKAG